MQHSAFSSKEFRRQVAAWFGPVVLILEWSLLALALWMSLNFPWLVPLGLVMIGRAQWALMDIIGHWAAHNTLFPWKPLNKLLQGLYFLLVFVTYDEWHAEHMAHHRHLGKEADPERATFERWQLSADTSNYFRCFLLVPFREFKKNLCQLRVWRSTELCCFWIAAILLIALTHSWPVLWIWLACHFCVKPYWMFLSETAEHWQAPVSDPKKMYGSRILTGVFFKLLKAYGDSFHAFHHSFPDIPPTLMRSAYKEYQKSASMHEADLNLFKKEVLHA